MLPLTRAWCAYTEQMGLYAGDQVKVGTVQGSGADFEAGKYEYDPTAIAVQDTVVMIDKPEAQIGNTHAANSFNVQYETV